MISIWRQDFCPLFLSDISIGTICAKLEGRTRYIVLKVPVNFDFPGFKREAAHVLEVRERPG